MVRIVSIENLDLSACGGTHVRATGEIGPILIRKLEKVRGHLRLEFLCGMRAVNRAHADYEALATIGRAFSATLDETPALVTAQIEKLQEAEKARRKLALDLARAGGRQLYSETVAGPDGVRRVRRTVAAITDEVRAEAQAYTGGEKAMFVVVVDDPPSFLIACSKDSGINAGQVVKDVMAKAGGRGGGSVTMAQGSVPDGALLESVISRLL
jgi:alanyl-tRNA synthetase